MRDPVKYAKAMIGVWQRKLEAALAEREASIRIDASICIDTEKESEGKEILPPNTPNREKEEKEKDVPSRAREEVWFDEFWDAYPKRRKYDPGKCKTKHLNIIKEAKKEGEALHLAIMRGLEIWKKSSDWTKDGGDYVCMPMTWLNQRRWETPPQQAARETTRPIAPRYTLRKQERPTSYLQSTPEQVARYRRAYEESLKRKQQ